MLVSDIYIDLPSEEIQRAKAGWDLFSSWLGQEEKEGTGKERLTVNAYEVFGKLVLGFKSAGLTNVISLMIDDDVLFLDESAEEDDLLVMVRQLGVSGRTEQPMNDLRLVLETKNQGMHLVLDVEILTSVRLGQEELHLQVSGRIDELAVREGETAAEYDTRVREFVRDWSKAHEYMKAMKRFSEMLKLSLKRALPYCPLRSGETYFQIIAPQGEQIGRFRDLVFGEQLLPQEYRPAPMVERRGFFADRFLYFYYDPYFNFLNWIIVDEMMRSSCLDRESVLVVEPGGMSLFRGHELDEKRARFGWISQAVTYDSVGRIRVSERIGEPAIKGDPLSDYSRFTPVNPTEWR